MSGPGLLEGATVSSSMEGSGGPAEEEDEAERQATEEVELRLEEQEEMDMMVKLLTNGYAG